MAQSKTERLIDLVALLLSRRVPVSKDEIKKLRPEYRRAGGETFDRIFERDKKELREIGVPVKVYHLQTRTEIPTTRDAGQYDADEIGYLIDTVGYFMPHLDLDSEEWLTLKVIGGSQGGRAVSPELAMVWQKLECQLPRSLRGSKGELAMAPGARADATAELKMVPKLMEAVREHRRVEFDYYTIGRDTETRRQADPYFLVYHGGMWYLLAHCHLRREVRVFKVSRISKLKTVKTAQKFAIPEGFDPQKHIGRKAWEFGLEPERKAVLVVQPREAWLVRKDLGDKVAWSGDSSVAVTVRNSAPFVRWAAANWDRVRIAEPADLALKVEQRVRAVREMYSNNSK